MLFQYEPGKYTKKLTEEVERIEIGMDENEAHRLIYEYIQELKEEE